MQWQKKWNYLLLEFRQVNHEKLQKGKLYDKLFEYNLMRENPRHQNYTLSPIYLLWLTTWNADTTSMLHLTA